MGQWLIWASVIALVFTASLPAQQSGSDEVPSTPDVRDLRADWWNFVASVPAPAREDRLAKLLAAARDAVAAIPAAQEELKKLIVDIEARAETYASLLSATQPAAPMPQALKEYYTLAELLGLHDRQKEISLELKIGREHAQRESRMLQLSEKQLSSKKASHFELAPGSAERLAAALKIINERLRLTIESEQLRLDRAQTQNWELELAHIDDEMAVALDRLRVDETHVENAATKAADFRDRAEAANSQVASVQALQYRLSEGATTQTTSLHAAQLIAAKATSVEYETIAQRFDLQSAYLAARLNTSDARTEILHQRRVAAETFIDETSKTIYIWREAATRERTRALKSLSTESAETNSEFEAIAEQRVALADDISRSVAQIEAELSRVRFLEEQAAKFLAQETGRIKDSIARSIDFTQNAWVSVKDWTSSSLFEINETPVTLMGIFRVMIILIIAIWISKAIRHGLDSLVRNRQSMNRSAVYMLGRIFHYVILGTAILIALSSLGLDFTKLAIVAGALGVGIGFGLQAIFSNFISGIIVLFERSLKVGDFVELESGVTGEVREINIRSTLITTNDNIDILVPNSEFVNGRVINWTLRDAHRRVRVPFGVAYGSDKDLVKKAVLEAAADVPFTLKNHVGRDPQVWLVEFGDSSLNFELVAWLTPDAVIRPGAVHAAYMWAIETALREYDIEIPFPQRDLNIRSFFGRRDELGFEWFDQARK